jgi:hypothetical protein
MASDDEKGQMLHAQQHNEDQVMDDGNVPLQSKEEGKYLKKKIESILTKKKITCPCFRGLWQISGFHMK